MHILVTGGAGFIGAAYVRHALALGHRVTTYDALTYAGDPARLEEVEGHAGHRFVHGDIRDRDGLAAAMSGCDAVVHLAAETHVDRSLVGPDDFISTNCLGTNVVMDVALWAEVDRVVHVGTDEVYGSVESGSSVEDDPLDPRSPYSASKAGADLIARSYQVSHGLPVVITRCTNNYGPFQDPEKAIPRFLAHLIDGRPAPLYGDGGHRRDWLHVDDHCRALQTALDVGEPGAIYNVGAGADISNRELLGILLGLIGRPGEDDLIESVPDRPGHDRRYSVDSSRMEALGWRRTVDLIEGLEATVEWYRAREAWWRPRLRERPGHPTASERR